MIKLCSFQVTLEIGLWAELIEKDKGTHIHQKKIKIKKGKIREYRVIGELLKMKEGRVEGKQSIPIYKVGSLAN